MMQPYAKGFGGLARLDETLDAFWMGMRRYNVTYHNDMHCLDVAQMTFIVLCSEDLDAIGIRLKLRPLEYLSVLIAALCHDYAHDGFNNGYHVKTESSRFHLHGADAVQEKYHFAEAFKIIERTKLLCGLVPEDQATFRRLMLGCILSTDMSKHNDVLKNVQEMMLQIRSDQHELVTDDMSADEVQERKEQLLHLVVHSSDISFLTRPMHVQQEWAYLLFEEFFHQGDIEREKGLPVSFLCDRETVNVAKSQKPFLDFAVMPLFKVVSELSPSKDYLY